MALRTVSYPPTIIHHASTKPVSLEDAQKTIAAYLKNSKRKPYLHPDAVLETSGPSYSVQGGRQGGLVLHQLRRVEAGLRGEILQPDPRDLLLSGNGDDAVGDAQNLNAGDDSKLDAIIAEAKRAMEEEESMEVEATLTGATPGKLKSSLKRKASALEDGQTNAALTNDGSNGKEAQVNGWQDPEMFTLQEEGTEVGELQRHSNFVGQDVAAPPVNGLSRKDKEARKAAKKDRKKAEKKARGQTRHGSGTQLVEDAVEVEPKRKEEKEESKGKTEGLASQNGETAAVEDQIEPRKKKAKKDKEGPNQLKEESKVEKKRKREEGEMKDKSEKKSKKEKSEAEDKSEKKKKKRKHGDEG
ncbi:hypothetical protein NA57DRAFT_56801 [Rhizodiscina lignyota]|uniref:Uncharacterized protein n=1 Tax=Rhizodiscina lignyota TaxID=1504668 RepID=A0A9P4IC73_9PEZI|nr:hypothetical protein NA57DRAFT_56801 [Rhizodiscina lignyota]